VGGIGRVNPPPHHMSVIAGDYLFGMEHTGEVAVISLGRSPKLVAMNRLGIRRYAKYDFFNEGAQIFCSGNRIFTRSYTDVYCIGDPNQPMRLSPVHDGEFVATAAAPSDSGASSGSEASSATTASAPAAAPAAEPDVPAKVVKKWEPALLALVANSIKKGDKPEFHLASMRTEVNITSLQGKAMKLRGRGIRLEYTCGDLSLAEKASIAAEVAAPHAPKQAAVAAFFNAAAGNDDEADLWMSRAGKYSAVVKKSLSN
jgi:hypothetical protein